MSSLSVNRKVSRLVRAMPYLKKELVRRASLTTGKVWATPMTYYVIISGRCNLACTFCTIHNYREPSLSGEVVLRIVREAKELSGSGFSISLSGGEPMIYPPLYDVLELAHKLGVDLGFTTNGLALTQNNIQRVLASNPFNVNISIESVDPKVNEVLRPFPNGTRRVLEGVERLAKEKERTGARLGIIVKPTIMDQNYQSLPQLVRHFGKDSLVQVNFQPYLGDRDKPFWVKDMDRLAAVIDELKQLLRDGYPIIGNEQTLDGFLAFFRNPPRRGSLNYLDLNGRKRNCDIGLRTMFIQFNGDVEFCDFLKQPLGNVNRQSLSDIYYGEVANAQRAKMLYCRIDCQQSCKRPTPLWVKAKAFLKMR